ncbi:MAG: aldehyde dehydrogenase family protein [Leptospiraceae bacterium]|nr:aldehyde dehydrogenase family protein [Leptospiraceae bacterium]MCP5501526.1 aldehyde dehydrogenase family protein [Leptospiraceae bacterium]
MISKKKAGRKRTRNQTKKDFVQEELQKKEIPSVQKTSETEDIQFQVINPANLEVIGSLPIFNQEQVEEKIRYARETFPSWSSLSLNQRSRELLKLRSYLAKNSEEMISTICLETGKSRMDALTEVLTVCESIDYVAKQGKKHLKPQKRNTGLILAHKKAYINYHPYGVVGVISPWNYPLILSLTPIVNALMAGNTVVLKPSEITPFTALKVLEFFQKAGLPEGILQIVTGKGSTGAALVESMGTHMICFTGSTATGKKIAETCAKMLKPVILELGGKDPLLVFEDANLKRAAKAAIWGGFFNSGQTCISVERVYVQDSVYDSFIHLLMEEYKNVRQGQENNFPEVGSMTSPGQVKILEEHYEDAQKKGAKILVGGIRQENQKGYYHKPAILVDVNHTMKIMKEETFGPEISIMRFSTEEEGIALANDSCYGLNSSIWTGNANRGKQIAKKIQSGSVCINDCLSNYPVSDLPFGGFKESGMGKVHGPEGIRSFSQIQSVIMNRWFWKLDKELWWYPYSEKFYKFMDRMMKLLFG